MFGNSGKNFFEEQPSLLSFYCLKLILFMTITFVMNNSISKIHDDKHLAGLENYF